MSPLKNWYAAQDIHSVINNIRTRYRRPPHRLPSPTEPIVLNAHTLSWTMPTSATLHAALQTFLADDILHALISERNGICFCEFTTRYIQNAVESVDVKRDCPRDIPHLVEVLRLVFTWRIVNLMQEELLAVASVTSLESMNEYVASETFMRHMSGRLETFVNPDWVSEDESESAEIVLGKESQGRRYVRRVWARVEGVGRRLRRVVWRRREREIEGRDSREVLLTHVLRPL